jgi:hypothetical protein
MMAAYRQHQQFYQQQRSCGQWNNNGMHPVMDLNSNMQGMGYPNYMGLPCPPHMAYAMQQHPQQYGGPFNVPISRQRNDNNNLQPQRPGWAESRPGRTPCKDDWWSHVKEDMQRIVSPKGIDLEKEDEHANVMEELQRTGTTSGVVSDGDDLPAAFEEHDGRAAGGVVGGEDYGGDLEAPFTPTPPTISTASGLVPAAVSDEDPHNRPQRQSSSPSKKAGQDGVEAEKVTRHGKQHRSSQGDVKEDGRRKSHKSKSHRRHSLKSGAEATPDNDKRRGSTLGDSAGFANSLFLSNAAPNAAPPSTKEQAAPRVPPPRRPTMDKGGGAVHGRNNNSSSAAPTNAAPMPITAAAARINGSSPGVRENSLPSHLPPLHHDELRRKSSAVDGNAESVMRGGQPRRSLVPDAFAQSDGRPESTTAAADSSGHSVGDNSRNRLSTSESALESSEVAKPLAEQNKEGASAGLPTNGRRQDQGRYSYFGGRRPTGLGEDDDDADRDSRDAYSSDSDEEDESSSSTSGSDDESDEEDSSESDEEADYSTMRRTPDHASNPGRSTLEYSAFRSMPCPPGVSTTEGDSRCDFPVPVGELTNSTLPSRAGNTAYAPGEARKSVGGYGMGSFSNSGSSDMPSHKPRPSHPNTSMMDDRAYMMSDMSLIERNNNNGPSGISTAASRSSSAQPHPQGRSYSVSTTHEDGSPNATSKPTTPQHQQQQRGPQAHTTQKDASDTAAKEHKPTETDGSESPSERLQRVGLNKRVPPKITTKPAAAASGSSSTTNLAAAPQTTVTTASTIPTLPNVQQQQQKNENDSATPGTAAGRADKLDAKLPTARANEKRVFPAVVGPTRPSHSVDDRRQSRAATGKENPGSSAGRPPVSAATGAASAAASKTPSSPQPALGNTVEAHRGSSGTSATSRPQASGAGKCPSLSQRTRKGSAASLPVDKASASDSQQPGGSGSSGVNGGESMPTAPKGLARHSVSSNQQHLGSNPLGLASNNSTGLANATQRRESTRGGQQQQQHQSLPHVRSGKVTLTPGKRSSSTPSSTPPTTTTAAATLNRTCEGGSAAHRLAPTASVETNIDTVSEGSSHRGDGSNGTSAMRLSTTRKISTRVPGGANGSTVTAPERESGDAPTPPASSSSPPPAESEKGKATTAPAPTQPVPALAAPVIATANTTSNTTVDDDVDTRDAWMAETYDFYAYSGRSLSDDEDVGGNYDKVSATPPQSAGAAHRNSSPTAPATRGGAKRLSVTDSSLADLGYIMF